MRVAGTNAPRCRSYEQDRTRCDNQTPMNTSAVARRSVGMAATRARRVAMTGLLDTNVALYFRGVGAKRVQKISN